MFRWDGGTYCLNLMIFLNKFPILYYDYFYHQLTKVHPTPPPPPSSPTKRKCQILPHLPFFRSKSKEKKKTCTEEEITSKEGSQDSRVINDIIFQLEIQWRSFYKKESMCFSALETWFLLCTWVWRFWASSMWSIPCF